MWVRPQPSIPDCAVRRAQRHSSIASVCTYVGSTALCSHKQNAGILALSPLDFFQEVFQKSHSTPSSKIILLIYQLTTQLGPPSILLKAKKKKKEPDKKPICFEKKICYPVIGVI